mgnify:CR=1 FL=1
MAPKIGLGGCLGASWAAPGASWVALGAILAPRGPQEPKIAPKPGSRYHPGPPKLEPKIVKKSISRLSKSDHFLIGCWVVFWCHLVPQQALTSVCLNTIPAMHGSLDSLGVFTHLLGGTQMGCSHSVHTGVHAVFSHTGASSGVGRAAVEALAGMGALLDDEEGMIERLEDGRDAAPGKRNAGAVDGGMPRAGPETGVTGGGATEDAGAGDEGEGGVEDHRRPSELQVRPRALGRELGWRRA